MFKVIYLFFKKTIGKKLFFTIVVLAALCELIKSCTLILPFLVEKFINQIQDGVFSLFYPKVGLCAYLAIFIIQSIIVWLYGKKQVASKVKLQLAIFDNLLKTNPNELKKRGEGFFTSLMENSVETLLNFLTPVSFSAFFNVAQIFIILAVLYYKNVFIGLVSSFLLLLYFIAFMLNNRLFSSILMDYIEKNSVSIAKIYDFIKGNKVLIANSEYQQFAHKKVQRILIKVQAIEFKLQYFFELIFSSLSNFIQPCTNLIIIVLLGKNVIDGMMPFGSFVLVLTYYNLLQNKFESFQKITDLMFHTSGALKGLKDFIDEAHFINPAKIENDGNYFLHFENVSLAIDGKTLLRNVNIKIPSNYNYGIVGSSGTGKSFFISLILGLSKPDSGKITFISDLQNCSDVFAMQSFAYLSQTEEIFNLPLQDNIFLSEKYDEAEFHELIEKFELNELAGRNLGSDGSAISGGEKQKVLLARFVHQIKQKSYYILDEPFTGMDIVTKKSMIEKLKPYLQNKTGLCITHDQLVLDSLCNKVLFLNGNHEIVLCNEATCNIEKLLLSD